MAAPVLSFDAGGTHVRAAAVGPAGIVWESKRRWPENSSPEGDIRVLAELAAEYSGARAGAVGIALGALLDREGVVLAWPNRPSWVGLAFRALAARALGAAVHAGDDANCAALAEHRLGAARPYSHALVLTVGTGIGAGLILDGALARGARGWAGELGHVTMWPEGQVCSCGRRGCLQALASGRALEAAARAHGRPGVAELLAAAEGEETWALEALRESARWLGIAAANAVNLLDLEAVVIGGGLGMLLPARWWAPVRAAISENILAPAHRKIAVERAALGDSAGLLGAALLAEGRA